MPDGLVKITYGLSEGDGKSQCQAVLYCMADFTMSPRLPAPSDFPASFTLSIVPPSSTQVVSNVLILLHGLGDTQTSFVALARNLSLPDTACVVVQAPTPLPFDLGGFHWGDDIVFDQASGQMDFDTGFGKASRSIGNDVIQTGLIGKCGFQRREIILLGYGQGGMAALAVAAVSTLEMGGVISIGGPLPADIKSQENKAKTPVLLLGGSSATLISAPVLRRVKDIFGAVEYKKWSKNGDGMPTNRDQMLPIMQFFARRLRSRQGVPEGSVEIR